MIIPENKKWKIFILVALALYMATLDSSIVNVALPYMIQDFNTDIRVIQWVVLIYLATSSSLLLTFGRFSDIKGRRIIFLSGFLIFITGSALCGMAWSPIFLIASRSVQGAGASMLVACSPPLIVDVFPAKERGRAIGLTGAIVAAGLTTGPFIGGVFLEALSWRYIFYINIPVGIGAIAYAFFMLNDLDIGRKTTDTMDFGGAVFMALMIFAAIILIIQLPEWGILSIRSFLFASAFISSTAGLFIIESKACSPLLDLNLLKIRLFLFPIIASSLFFATLSVIVFMLPFYLTFPCRFSPLKTGVIMAVPFLFLFLFSPLSGALYNRFGSRKLCMVGMFAMAISVGALSAIRPTMSIFSILWRIALVGIGAGLFLSPNNTTIMTSVPNSKRGTASGIAATVKNIGMAAGVSMAGIIFHNSFLDLTGGSSLKMYQAAMVNPFMISFQKTMFMGFILTIIGLFITHIRGKERTGYL